MSLYDFFFPAQAQATHLRQLVNDQQRLRRSEGSGLAQAESRIASLEGDVGYLALLLGVLLQKVDEKGMITRAEVQSALAEMDGVDGIRDGRLDVSVLRNFGGGR